MIDSHIHLDFSEFDDDRDEILKSANQVGVTDFIVPGVAVPYWPRLAELSKRYNNIYPAYGLHPYFVEEDKNFSAETLSNYLENNQAVAVGECGIDSSRPNIDKQAAVFAQHIEVANQFEKPLIVHHMKSHHLIFSVFKRIKPKFGGVIHAFSGSLQDAEKYLALGFKLGCGGTITYERANKTKQVFSNIALDCIVLETDAPSMPISGKQGQRNEPQNLLEVAKTLSQIRPESLVVIQQQTANNTKQLFSL